MLLILYSRTKAGRHRAFIYLRLESTHNFRVQDRCSRKYTVTCSLLPSDPLRSTVSRGSSQCNAIRDADENPPPLRPANRTTPIEFFTHVPPVPRTYPLLHTIIVPELPGAGTRMDALQPVRARTQTTLDDNEHSMGRPDRLDNLRHALRPHLGHVARDSVMPIRLRLRRAGIREGQLGE